MMNIRTYLSVLLLSATSLGLMSTASAQSESRDDYRATYQRLSQRNAAAIVTVKYVMSMTGSGNEESREDRAQGVLVGADGLILVNDRAVSFDLSAFGGARTGASMVAKSSDFRVQMQGSEEWIVADLVTRDPTLGIAWLRLQQAPKGLTHVDLSNSVKPEPGMVFHSLLRTSESLGSVVVWRPGLVLGQTSVPKTRLLVDGVPGLAFDTDGKVVGWVDIDFDTIMEGRNRAGLSGDVSNISLQMVDGVRLASATARAAKMPSVKSSP